MADSAQELDEATKAASEHVAAHPPPDPKTVTDQLPPALAVPDTSLIRPHAADAPLDRPTTAPHPELLPSHGLTRYESRIRIVEAWQYKGSLIGAPSFVDRSWAAWGDYDDERKINAGPALRVPTGSSSAEKLCRVGDYVVRQEVVIALELDPDVQVDVWRKDEFEKFFLPARRLSPPTDASGTSGGQKEN